MRDYELLPDEELTQEYLMQDREFLQDAAEFLAERAGEEVYTDEEIMERFLNQMRSSSVNEASMIADLEYAQEADDAAKARFGRLIDTFDRMETTDGFGSKLLDYGEGIATAPSTIAGLATGFIGKGAGIATGMAARSGLKGLLSQAAQKATAQTVKAGALRGAAVEAPIAAVGEDLAQRTREEVGLGREEGAVATAAAFGGVFGGGFGAIGGALGKNMGKRADELAQTAQRSVNLKRSKQRVTNKTQTEKLMQINPDLVEHGRKVLDDLNQNEKLSAYMDQDTMESVAVAATRFASKLKLKPNQRITETVIDAMMEGEFSTKEVQDLLDEHGITITDFVSAYATTVSDAGRTLGRQGRIMKALQEKGFISPEDADTVADFSKGSKFVDTLRAMDRLRLGAMTSQLATTVRNTVGGGFRMAVDVFDTGFASLGDALVGKKTVGEATKDIFSTTRFFLDPKTGQVVKELFEANMPTEARKLFFSAASAEARHGGDGVLSKVANSINVANTISDNIFKRAIFSSTLDRQLREKTGKSLIKTIQDGEFNTIDKDVIKKSVEDSLYFTYQNRPSYDTIMGRLGNNVINMHKDAPFVVSMFMPFPRFIMSQLKFFSEHAPIPGAPFTKLVTQGRMPTKEELAKNATGSVLLGAGLAWRAQQDSSTAWHEYYDDKGNVVDITGTLGPMAPYVIMGDLIIRARRGDPIDSIGQYAKDSFEALGTPRFRGTFGLPPIDGLYDDFVDGKWDRGVGKLLGDVMGTYTIPAAVIRDFASVYNPDARFVEDLNRIIVGDGPDAYVNWWDYSILYASKYLPYWNEDGGLTYSVPEEQRRYSSTKGVLKKTGQIGKQFTGLTTYTPKTEFEKEIDRLQIPRYELYGRDKDPVRNAINQKILGEKLPEMMLSYMKSADYQMMNDIERAAYIKRMVNLTAEEIGVRDIVDGQMEEMIQKEKPYFYNQIMREAYESIGRRDRRLLEQMWEESDEYNGMTIYEAGAFNWAVNTYKSAILERVQ